MFGSWINLAKTDPLKNENIRVKAFTNSHTLLFKFNDVQSTGVFMQKKSFNELFFNVKAGYYAPLTHFIKNKKEVESFRKYKKRREKFLKYYTTGQFKKITELHIMGEDPYLGLPHALAFWPNYDLLKQYFNNVPLKSIDQTLWANYNYAYNTSGYVLPYEKPIINTRRFNFFGLMRLILSGDIPLFYKDGFLLASQPTLLADLSIYNKPTAKEVVKTVIKKLSDPKLMIRDFIHNGKSVLIWCPTVYMFPFIITLPMTDYGHVVNLYKFNFETLEYELVFVKPVYSHNLFIRNAVAPMRFSLELLRGGTLSTCLEQFDKAYYVAHFGVDEDYLYLYDYKIKDSNEIKMTMLKVPLKAINSIRLNGSKYTINYIGNRKATFNDARGIIGTIIPEKLIAKSRLTKENLRESPVFNK